MGRGVRTRLTKAEKANLARFGCFLRSPEETFYIDWAWPQLKAASNAPVSVRFIPGSEADSPLLCTAFEVCPVRFLPRYSFFPLDLRKKEHTTTLDSILQKEAVNICFTQQGRCLKRTLILPKSHAFRLASLHKASLDGLTVSERRHWDLAHALREFESTQRAPQHFNWLLSEAELTLSWPELKRNKAILTDKVVNEHKLFVTALYEVLQRNHGATIAKWFEDFPLFLQGAHFAYDLYSTFGRDPKQLVEYLCDLTVADFHDVEKFGWVPQAVDSICGLLSRMAQAPAEQKEELLLAVVESAAEFGRRLSVEGRVSWRTFLESLAHLKPLLHGRPGRPMVGYSLARKLKREDELSWKEVSQKIFDESPAFQAELGQARFADLPPSDQLRFVERIRQGVRRGERAPKPEQEESH